MMMKWKLSKCKRCGLCCAHFPHCGHGNENGKHGMCSFLVIDMKKKITSCNLMLQGKIKPDRAGCVLKKVSLSDIESQKYFKQIHKEWRADNILP